MPTIQDITIEYTRKIDFMDLELLIADSLNKTREFVLSHPEYKVPSLKIEKLKFKIARRVKGEPIAYILGHKEFYGLNFLISKDTLVPRPETEMLVELAIQELEIRSQESDNIMAVDIGTGSGCIITSIAHSVEHGAWSMEQKRKVAFFGSDIITEALRIARKNAKKHDVDKKIKFLHGSLLEPLVKKINSSATNNQSFIITANLPYLSKEIYQSAPTDVKKYEPRSALYSAEGGLAHYHKLLLQIKKNLIVGSNCSVACFFEISPEQKSSLTKLIQTIFPKAKTTFHKDLAGKWRVCKITL